MTATHAAFTTLAMSMIGIRVLATEKDGSKTIYNVARLDTKIGTMKDGTKAEYVVLQRADNEAVVVSLHPNVAKKLFNKGADAGFEIEPVSAADVIAAEEQVELQAELDEQQALTTEDADKVPEVAKEVKVSKKSQAVAIYKEVIAAGGARKEVIARFTAELGMGAPGASTYYQNCKGGLWA